MITSYASRAAPMLALASLATAPTRAPRLNDAQDGDERQESAAVAQANTARRRVGRRGGGWLFRGRGRLRLGRGGGGRLRRGLRRGLRRRGRGGRRGRRGRRGRGRGRRLGRRRSHGGRRGRGRRGGDGRGGRPGRRTR